MNSALWRRVTEVFWEARALNESARGCYLEEACGEDGELLAHVQRLLTSDAAISDDSVHLNGLMPAGAGQLIAGRFQTRERLGSGGFGDVYRAYDTLLKMPVALKILRDPDPKAVQRFKREFRRLMGFLHPNVVRLYELLHHGGQWMLTMELLDGGDFLEACRDAPAALPGLLEQLTAGVEGLHEAGILHRDLKPKNIRVSSEGRVVLLDFGLVQELDPDTDSRSRTIALTPAYAAPEQAEPGHPLTGAADWYAVGVILYEALTGRQPFEGHWQEVLRRKQSEDPPPPGEAGPLADLCVRLLDRNPLTRAGAAEIRRALGLAQAAQIPSQRSRFQARRRELARLAGLVHRSKPGATLVRITGGSGIGKTALVREFLRRAKDASPETVILAGRCYEGEAVPFKSMDEIAESAVRYLKSLPPAVMESLLPRNVSCLANLLPVFAELIAGRSALLPEDLFERRRRASSAWRELLGRIAERRRLIVSLDDLQWGDKDSEPFLRDLIADHENPPFLLLMACPDDPAILARMDSLGNPDCVIALDPFNEEDATALAASLMENETAASPRVRAVVREAAGNPYRIEELARYAASLPEDECAALSMDHLLEQRLSELDWDARRMLEAICAARRPVSLDQAALAAQIADPMACRNHLLALRLIRSISTAEGERYQPQDERIRGFVPAPLAAETIREFHLRFSETSTGALDRFHHLELAGQWKEASACALTAADDAASLLAFDRAAALYESALRLGSPAGEQRAAILVRMGEALANAGRGAGAATAFLDAAAASPPLEALRLRARAADQYLRCGYTTVGDEVMQTVLREAGIWYPKRRWANLSSLAFHRLRIRLLGRRLEQIAPREADPFELARAECCWAAAIGFGLWNPLRGAEFSARHLLMAHRTGDPYRLALAFGAEAVHLAHTEPAATGRADRMLDLARQSALISRSEHAAAFVTAMRAITTFLAGRWRESKGLAETAIQSLRENCVNVSRDLQRTYVFLLSNRFLLGEMRDSGRLLDELVDEARERGDVFATEYLPLAAFGYAIHLARGDREKALAGVHDLGAGAWGPLQVMAFRARTSVALYDGDAGAAWEMVERHWGSIRRTGYLRLQMLGDFLIGARARCAIAMAAAASRPEPWLRIAERDSRRMRQSSLRWSRAHGALAEAGVASCRGNYAAARDLLLEGERGLEACEMGLWLAAARYRLGDERRGAAMRWFDEQQVQSPDRFADLILPGRWRLPSSRSESAI